MDPAVRICRFQLGAAISLVFAIASICVATFVYDNLQSQLQAGLASQFIISSPDSGAFSAWADSDDPNAGAVYSTYYVYNISNPDEVLAGGKPNVTEIGPLVYLYHNKKYNVTWDVETDGDVLQYFEYQYYTPVDNATIDLASTMITTLNVPLLSVLTNPVTAAVVAFTPSLSEYTNPSALFIQRPAGEVLFGWTNDSFLTDFNAHKGSNLIPEVPTAFPGLQPNDSSLEYALATHSFIRMYTGTHSADKMMEYAAWSGANTMQCCLFAPCGDVGSGGSPAMPWGSFDANAIAGTQGSQFKLNVGCDDVLRVATYDFGIYRHWNMECDPNGGYSTQGISLLRFNLEGSTMNNYTMDPVIGKAYNSYGPSGLLNQSNCESGAPIYLSKPRFLDADPSLADALTDFPAPDRNAHDTWLGVEPTTGSTLDFHWRIAVNVHLSSVNASDIFSEFTFFPSVTPVFMPLAWGGQDSGISDSQASEFKGTITLAHTVIAGVRWGGVALAGACGIIAVSLLIAAEVHRRRALQPAAAAAGNGFYTPLPASRDSNGFAASYASLN